MAKPVPSFTSEQWAISIVPVFGHYNRVDEQKMKSFFQDRGLWLAAVVLIMVAISLAQMGVSYAFAFGDLRRFLPIGASLLATILAVLRFGLVSILVVLWTLKRKRALFRFIIIVNFIFTLALLVQTSAIIDVLFRPISEAFNTLMLDVILMWISNILIFSVWYWIIDPPGVEEHPRSDEPWHFLFPQRGGGLPHYEEWEPRYTDYLFVAFMTSCTFSPSDALPLTRRAKMLMLMQAAISIISLTVIVGNVINNIAGSK